MQRARCLQARARVAHTSGLPLPHADLRPDADALGQRDLAHLQERLRILQVLLVPSAAHACQQFCQHHLCTPVGLTPFGSSFT